MSRFHSVSGGLVVLGISTLFAGSGCFIPRVPVPSSPQVVHSAPRQNVTYSAPAPRPTRPRAAVRVNTPIGSAQAVISGSPINSGAAANGVISYPRQRVRYPINITYPRVVNIYVDGHGLDPTVAIYNAYGQRMAFNDDGGSGLDSQLSTTLTPGSYIIEVAGYSTSTGPFTLNVN